MTTARINVYIQALGGKFLGPNAYQTNKITLSLTIDEKPHDITYKYVDGMNDGSIGPTFLYELPSANGLSSFLPILTPTSENTAVPATNFLTPNNNTISATLEFDIPRPVVLGTLKATIPRPYAEDAVVTQTIALNQQQSNYRAIMIVPGLLLEPLVPPGTQANSLSVLVKMMCGCPITSGIPHSFWAESDFRVSAQIFYKHDTPEVKNLTFPGTTPSLYQVPVVDITKVAHVNFTARQRTTGNTGYLSLDY